MLVAELYVVKHLPDATRDTGGAEREKGLDAAFAKDLLQSRDGFLHRLVLEEWLTSGRKGNYEAFPLLSPETVRKKGPSKNQTNQAQYLRLAEMVVGGESSNVTKCTTSLPAPLSSPRGQFAAARYGDLKVCVNALVGQVPVDDRRDVALRNLRPQLFNPGAVARTLDDGSPSDNPHLPPTEFTKNFGSFAMSLFQFHEFTFLGFHCFHAHSFPLFPKWPTKNRPLNVLRRTTYFLKEPERLSYLTSAYCQPSTNSILLFGK